MSQLNVVFQNRDFTSKQTPSYLKFSVASYNFKSIGGCDKAAISVTGGEIGVWELANWLRCPITIYDSRGVPVWWGYVHEVDIRQGALEVMASMDSLVNRAAVVYNYVEPGTAAVGARKTTAWADHSASQTEYGTKSMLRSASGMSDAAAENMRAAILASQAWPQGGLTQKGGSGRRARNSSSSQKINATLNCRGWWETLGWKYYSNSGMTNVATTTQIGAIVTSAGQFLTATDTDAASGISSSEYRDGDSTALAEILSLLAAGGANGRRLLASVDPNRRLQIWEEPATSTSAYYLDSQAQLYGAGGLVVNDPAPPVGVWCRLKDVLPGVVDLTKLADPSLQFIEEARWSADNGASYDFKGQPGASSLLAVGG